MKSITIEKTVDGYTLATPEHNTTAIDLEMALEYTADYFNADSAPTEEAPIPDAVVVTDEVPLNPTQNGTSQDTGTPSEANGQDSAA